MNALHINGNDLTLEDLREVVYARRPVLLDTEARERVERARAVVDDLVANDRLAYAITTGVGMLSDVRINPEQNRELQVNLLRSHAVGVGEPLNEAETRAMMLLRANSLAKGFSGVRPEVINTLCEMLNRGVHPIVPSQGSVGASGDLAPLAHLALVLIGEGEAGSDLDFRAAAPATAPPLAKRDLTPPRENRALPPPWLPGAEALARAGLAPITLGPKEGLALINGTQPSAAVLA